VDGIAVAFREIASAFGYSFEEIADHSPEWILWAAKQAMERKMELFKLVAGAFGMKFDAGDKAQAQEPTLMEARNFLGARKR